MERVQTEIVIAEMNRCGLAVDISSLTRKTTLGAARRSLAPVVAGECVSNDVITLSQDQINVIKERNGVVRVAIPLHAERPGADVAGCTASLIDRAVALVGIDHVAVEQEHSGGPHRSSRVASEVKDQLERRGYGEVELEKLWNDNLRRVFDDISRVSGALRQM